MVSCKPASNIITSKDKAIKLNRYQSFSETVSKSDLKKEVVRKNEPLKSKTAEVEEVKQKPASNEKPKRTENLENDLVENAKLNLGSPYLNGGTTKEGFDCSGLIYTTFKNFDFNLPRTSNEMSKFGRVLEISEVKKGDLIFFRTNGNDEINHVGIIVEITDDAVKFIHSSTQKGVIISSTKEAYYNKTFAQLNRVTE